MTVVVEGDVVAVWVLGAPVVACAFLPLKRRVAETLALIQPAR